MHAIPNILTSHNSTCGMLNRDNGVTGNSTLTKPLVDSQLCDPHFFPPCYIYKEEGFVLGLRTNDRQWETTLQEAAANAP